MLKVQNYSEYSQNNSNKDYQLVKFPVKQQAVQG